MHIPKISIHLKVGNRIFDFAIIYYQLDFIMFGGKTHLMEGQSNTVARLDLATSSWTKLGNLKAKRSGHGVIFDGEVFLIIGGESDIFFSHDLKIEKCTLSGNKFRTFS